MKNMPILLSLGAAVLIIGGASMLNAGSGDTSQVADRVYREGGKQIIEINAKGGFTPQVTTAQSGVPTILRVSTNGTYDCSSGLRIPKLGIRENLEATGVRDIDIPAESAQGTLDGTCTMGMYNFSVNFM